MSGALDEMPLGGIVLTIVSIATKVFSHSIAAPLSGIGIAIMLTHLVKKGIACYNNKLLISIRKEIYKINKNHKNMQLAAVIFSFALSYFCRPLGFVMGLGIGTYSTLIFDVERAKLTLSALRQKRPA